MRRDMLSGVAATSGESERTLFASDLDFTLLRSDTTLSEHTISVINRLVESGSLFTYATARSFTSAARVTAGLRLTAPVITYGGALLVDPATAQILAVESLPRPAVDAITSVSAARDGVEPVLFALVDGRDRVCWLRGRETPFVGSFLDDRKGDPRLLPLAMWSDIADAQVFYVSLIGTSAQISDVYRRLSPQLEECFFTVGPDRYQPEQTWFEISSKDATKAVAAERLRQGLDASNLVVFGDNLNDVPLFEAADRAYAVANAIPELLAIATEVIPSNDEDGVATWLTESVLTANDAMSPGPCAECGFDWTVDSARLVTRCDALPETLRDIIGSADAAARRRPSSQTWSPIEYVAHLDEAVRWYVARIRRVLDENLPQLEAFDFDEAAEEGGYNSRELATVFRDLDAACRELTHIARSVTRADLARPGLGSDGTPRTAAVLLSRVEHELVHHDLDIRKVLNAPGTRP